MRSTLCKEKLNINTLSRYVLSFVAVFSPCHGETIAVRAEEELHFVDGTLLNFVEAELTVDFDGWRVLNIEAQWRALREQHKGPIPLVTATLPSDRKEVPSGLISISTVSRADIDTDDGSNLLALSGQAHGMMGNPPIGPIRKGRIGDYLAYAQQIDFSYKSRHSPVAFVYVVQSNKYIFMITTMHFSRNQDVKVKEALHSIQLNQ